MKMKFYSLWLSAIIIMVFLLQYIPGFTELFLLTPSAFFQPWRFITSIFLHASLSHLILNLFSLALFGFILEKIIGSRKFITIFFISGIFANIIAVNFYSASLGASGAIFGIIGALTIIKPLMMVWAFSVPLPLFIVAILYIVINLIQTFVPSDIGTIAHLSGIAIGLIAGLLIKIKMPKKTAKQKIEIPEPLLRQWEQQYLNLPR